MIPLRVAFLSVLLIGMSIPASGQEREVPYWASVRASELNLRVGPSEDYPVEWVYHRAGLPVKVLRVMQGWRFIEDPDGTRGWVVARLLSPERAAIVTGNGLADMRADAGASAPLKWRVEPGVSGMLGSCKDGWCSFVTGRYRGWIRQDRLWGAGAL